MGLYEIVSHLENIVDPDQLALVKQLIKTRTISHYART